MAKKHDFFISYASADERWAQWISWVLEEQLKYRVFYAGDDVRPGENVVLSIQRNLVEAERCIVLLSGQTLFKELTETAWTGFFHDDPEGAKAQLLPVRVAEIEPQGLLEPLKSIDLFGLDENAAIAALRKAITWQPNQPRSKPAYPMSGSAPAYPGGPAATLRGFVDTSPPAIGRSTSPRRGPEHITAVLDKRDQAKHVKDQLDQQRAAVVAIPRFVMLGHASEWPEAVRHKIAALLGKSEVAEMHPLTYEYLTGPDGAATVLRASLAGKLQCAEDQHSLSAELSSGKPKLFYRILEPAEVDEPDWIDAVLKAWAEILGNLDPSAPVHVLILIYAVQPEPPLLQRALGRLRGGSQRIVNPDKLVKALDATGLKHQVLLPDLVSPQKDEIAGWVTNQFSQEPDEARSEFKEKVEKLFSQRHAVPHGELREPVVNLIRQTFQ